MNLRLRSILLYMLVGTGLCACRQKVEDAPVVKAIESMSSESISPYLTQDEQGQAVLCWTEKGPDDTLFRLKYSIYDSKQKKFGPVITVPGSEGAQTGPENMGKVAFKNDGTVIAVFGKKFLDQKNPFAGAIYYSVSNDKGKTWTDPLYLHSDTGRNYGRGFFDVQTLKNGEVGAVWLDGRFGKSEPGSAIFFSSTANRKGFGRDRVVDRNTCECCRTDLLLDKEGKLHLAYRKILFPGELMGKQVRDMVYTSSADNGTTFAPVKTISKDNWALEGCPHTGPSLAMINQQPAVAWFSAGGSPGLYFSQLQQPGKFSPRQLMSGDGRHPQIISLPDSRYVTVWEEGSGERKHSTTHAASMTSHDKSTASTISVNLYKNGRLERNLFQTTATAADHHAVMTQLNEGVLVAWVHDDGKKSSIKYAHITVK